jgi:hypothetical protein
LAVEDLVLEEMEVLEEAVEELVDFTLQQGLLFQ